MNACFGRPSQGVDLLQGSNDVCINGWLFCENWIPLAKICQKSQHFRWRAKTFWWLICSRTYGYGRSCLSLTEEAGRQIVVLWVFEKFFQKGHQVAKHIAVSPGQLGDQLSDIKVGTALKWLHSFVQPHEPLNIRTVPVCRGGCRESSLGTVGRVRSTPLAPARPPRRWAGPRLQSGYNQLHRQLGKNKHFFTLHTIIFELWQIWNIWFFWALWVFVICSALRNVFTGGGYG